MSLTALLVSVSEEKLNGGSRLWLPILTDVILLVFDNGKPQSTG
jgi:hypothetical protein